MKHIHYFILSILTIALFQACVIEERYHFHEDMSGEYSMLFDYSLLAEEDSSGELKMSMDLMMDSILESVNFVEGISDAKGESDGYTFSLSYGFDSVNTLNEIEAMDGEEAVKAKADVFKLKGKRLQFRPDYEELTESLDEEDEETTAEDKEVAESLSQMFKVRTIISFDKNVKVKSMKYFKEIEKNTFEYNSEVEGFDVQPVLDVKL